MPNIFENSGPDKGEREGLGGIASELDLGERENIAIIGGGGKTSLMFALAEALSLNGKRVVATTTTKVFQGEAERYPEIILPGSGEINLETLKESLEKQKYVFIGHRVTESGKIEGISGDQADRLFENEWIDYVISEADGSAGRPLKAHAAHEPVIPDSATMVIAVAGLEALGKKIGPDIVFREELFLELMGMYAGDLISEEVLAEIFLTPDGLFKGTPSNSRRVAFFNKIDRIHDERAPGRLARLILGKDNADVDFVVTGSLVKGSFSVYRKSV
ncbi:selenium cofactor biosynthesis protein YqeC [Thermodesulfobacteriota bacterium]